MHDKPPSQGHQTTPGLSAFETLTQSVASAPTQGAPPDDRTGALPASWYRERRVQPVSTVSDLLKPAGLGALTGLMLLGPLALLAMLPAGPAPDQQTFAAALVAERPLDLFRDARLVAEDQLSALVERAQLKITAGDIFGARTLLARADVARDATALFLMAETYDPARLVVWGARGVLPDPVRARALYAAANALGHADADARLAALP
jgi:hypothetical protein